MLLIRWYPRVVDEHGNHIDVAGNSGNQKYNIAQSHYNLRRFLETQHFKWIQHAVYFKFYDKYHLDAGLSSYMMTMWRRFPRIFNWILKKDQMNITRHRYIKLMQNFNRIQQAAESEISINHQLGDC
jgi:virulence-associated protein VapD